MQTRCFSPCRFIIILLPPTLRRTRAPVIKKRTRDPVRKKRTRASVKKGVRETDREGGTKGGEAQRRKGKNM